ncbi:MAG: hypothetical protein NTW87_30480 [Planctomycetota bacterium]|nr:hypothetical protein [Planctomycetota bacterium]
MVTALRQVVTIQPGGRIEITAPELRAGTKAEVIVLLAERKRAGRAAKSHPKPAQRKPRAGRGGFERFIGAVNSGDPHSADNDRIDADLAREYENTHEEGN